jgi:hypothetical protein
VPVRQWVISIPKRLRGMLADWPARGPPAHWGELVQIHDDRAIFQESPDELAVIDIQNRL